MLAWCLRLASRPTGGCCARDAIDRDYAKPLDIAGLARIALVSEAHFSRTFKQAFGDPPYRYLQRRRIERAMTLLRNTDLTVSQICIEVGFAGVDADLGFMRWLTVNVPGDKNREILLEVPGRRRPGLTRSQGPSTGSSARRAASWPLVRRLAAPIVRPQIEMPPSTGSTTPVT